MNERPYKMTARAAAASATGDRILDAATSLFWEGPTDALKLDDVARRAGVTVQTVIRRFGGRDGLLVAAAVRESARVAASRAVAEAGNIPYAVANLVQHYEEMGAGVLRLLAEEGRTAGLAPILAQGRLVHRDWCAAAFSPFLGPLPDEDRRVRLAQFVAICDVFTWRVLRQDCRLSIAETQAALIGMIGAIANSGSA